MPSNWIKTGPPPSGQMCVTFSAQAVSHKKGQMLMLARVQAIQARRVLRGTVGELVKETRKQQAEGALLTA